MKPIAMRYCCVSDQAERLADVFDRLGMARRSLEDAGLPPGDGFQGAIFEVGNGWIEIWPTGEGMPAGTMLQLVVEQADALAAAARAAGLAPNGPMDAHGERIYFLDTPGPQLSFQSTLAPG